MPPPDPTPDRPDDESAVRYHPQLSRNQKKRSKLSQAPEEAPAAEQPPEPTPPPPAPPAPAPLRRTRLKRSGQMHDDLKEPLPGDRAPTNADEY